MDTRKQLIKKIFAIVLIIMGLVFGVTWSGTRVCFGDHVFSIFGLPAWSKGTSGTHYPAIVGMVMILIGIAALNITLSKKARLWVWSIIILILLVIGFGSVYMYSGISSLERSSTRSFGSLESGMLLEEALPAALFVDENII